MSNFDFAAAIAARPGGATKGQLVAAYGDPTLGCTRTGKGRFVELNMMEAAIPFIPDPFANYTILDSDHQPLTPIASSHSFAFPCASSKPLASHPPSPPTIWARRLRGT